MGELVLLDVYLLQLTRPIDRLGQLWRSIEEALVDPGQLPELLTLPTERDRPGALDLADGPVAIRFEGVRFAYDPERPVLDGLDLEVPAGRTVAIVGPSGAGKTTIVRLIYRFLEPEAGRITIDGRDLGELRPSSLRAKIAVGPRDVALLNDTLGATIARSDPTADPASVEAAARAAALGELLDALRRGSPRSAAR